MDILRKLFRLNSTLVMSFCVQQVKVGLGLLREACRGESPYGSRVGSETPSSQDDPLPYFDEHYTITPILLFLDAHKMTLQGYYLAWAVSAKNPCVLHTW